LPDPFLDGLDGFAPHHEQDLTKILHDAYLAMMLPCLEGILSGFGVRPSATKQASSLSGIELMPDDL